MRRTTRHALPLLFLSWLPWQGACEQSIVLGKPNSQHSDDGGPAPGSDGPDAARAPKKNLRLVLGKTYTLGAGTSALVAADFDRDGKLDLALLHPATGLLSIHQGDGSGGFRQTGEFATGPGPASVAVADFNGDGKLDLAVACLKGDEVSVLLGDGHGGFAPAFPHPVGPQPGAVAAADLDGDGKPDLAVAEAGTNQVGVLLGRSGPLGTGTVPVAQYGTGTAPFAVFAADADGDGKLDLLSGNTDQSVSLLPGDGSGGFAQARPSFVIVPMDAIALQDLSEDQLPDLAVLSKATSSVHVFLNKGGGSFSNIKDPGHTDYPVSGGPTALLIADFNDDGHLDLVVASVTDSRVRVLLGNGSGIFTLPFEFPCSPEPSAMALGDFDGDGEIDVAVASGSGTTLGVLLNRSY